MKGELAVKALHLLNPLVFGIGRYGCDMLFDIRNSRKSDFGIYKLIARSFVGMVNGIQQVLVINDITACLSSSATSQFIGAIEQTL